jgi:hypothetical protein
VNQFAYYSNASISSVFQILVSRSSMRCQRIDVDHPPREWRAPDYVSAPDRSARNMLEGSFPGGPSTG